MIQKPDDIALYDMDGTLCDYDAVLKKSMEELRYPGEPPYAGVPRDKAPPYLRARSDLIRSKTNWWADLPRFQLGFDIWELTLSMGYRHMILTQGPKRNPKAWMGKKIWIDKNLGTDVDITITRDKGLVYGKILVDDWPEYVLKWLEWRPRGLVIMPAQEHNVGFSHPQVIRYDGTNLEIVKNAIQQLKDRKKNGPIYKCGHCGYLGPCYSTPYIGGSPIRAGLAQVSLPPGASNAVKMINY